MTTPPSAWQLEQVMSIAMATRARLEADGVIDTDGADLFAECPDAETALVRILRAMTEAEANAEAVAARINDLSARRQRFQRQREECRGAAFAMLEALGLTKFKSAEFTVSVSPGRPGVVVTDEAALPDAFVRVVRTADKTAIGCALAEGREVPGAERANGIPTMVVRTK